MENSRSSAKVVFFVPSLEGGIGRVISLLALGMHKKGTHVEIWSAKAKSTLSYNIDHKITCKYIGKGSVSSTFIPLLHELRLNGPITLISASFHTNITALLASIFIKTKNRFIISDHPSIDAALEELSYLQKILWKALIYIFYPMADAHIAVSQGVANAMAKYGRIDRSKISVIPNPVITDEMVKQGSVQINHPFFGQSEPIILNVGRLSYEKDIPTLIHAFKIVQHSIPSRLIIIGDGPERERLEDIVNHENISHRVSFLGHQNNPYAYYPKSDLFALSSTREGLPTVLIEALSFGIRVVSTDCPSGPREILKNGKYGQLVSPRDEDALAKAIVDSLRKPAPTVPTFELDKYTVEKAVLSYKKVV